MTAPARIIFAGTPAFALDALKALHAGGYAIPAVITQPDRRSGRGRKLQLSPVKQWAQDAGLRLIQPARWKDESLLDALRAIAADLMVVAAYGAILPPAALALCRLGAVNIHASLLPRWRGASPVAAAILAGDERTGVTLMQMEAGLDSGPILARSKTPIAARETAGRLEDRLAGLGARLLLRNLPRLLEGRLEAAPQDQRLATYAPRITKAQARIDWSLPAEELARGVRAYDPWPVSHALWRGRTVRFWGARALEESAAPPGCVVRVGPQGMDLATGAGVLRVREVQLPGRRRMPAADAARGAPLAGSVFA